MDHLRTVCEKHAELMQTVSIHTSRTQLQTVVDEMLACKGKVIFTGSGKSAMLAIVAASTITYETRLHCQALDAGMAIHGDMGQIGPDDVVIVLSRSGHSAEPRQMIETALRYVNPIVICITEHSDSPLAKLADHVLETPVTHELDPFDVVVTSSYMAALTVCHAIGEQIRDQQSVGLLELSSRHPAGAIGEKYATESRKGN